MCPTEKPEYKNLVFKKMCRVIHLYMLAIVLSVVSSMGVIPQSILLFILKRMLHIFKNKSFKIPFGEILFPILRPCGRGVAWPCPLSGTVIWPKPSWWNSAMRILQELLRKEMLFFQLFPVRLPGCWRF